jgi:hypothetical protein
MRKLFGILTLVLVPVVSHAADNGLDWAYPIEPPPGNNADAAPPSKPVNQALIAASYTGLPKMPEVVAKVSRCPACNAISPTATGIPNRLTFPA